MHGSVVGTANSLEIDAEDSAEILLEFGDQIIGSMHLNYTQIPGKHTLEIVGTKGSIFWDYYRNTVQAHQLSLGGELISEIFSCPQDFDRNDLFLAEMKHFLTLIGSELTPVCSLDDGVAALELALTARERGLL